MKKLRRWLEDKPFLYRIRLFFGLITLLLALFFLYLKVVPFGAITYNHSWPRGLASGKGFIYDFKPAERIDSTSSSSLRLIADPVYFSLYAPRAFDSAEITIKYRDRLASDTPIIEVGILRDRLTGQYELKPIQNDIIDKYRFSWPRLEDNSNRLILQAENYYNDLVEFERDLKSGHLKNCPGGPSLCVAAYNYPLDIDFRLPDYTSFSPTVITQPLRGAHQFYVYFRPGDWRLAFDFIDLNLDKELDPITVNVYLSDKIVATKIINDEVLADNSGQSEEKKMLLSGQDASGLYRVEIKSSDDIVISRLESSSDKISFINKIRPVSGQGNLVLFTDASYIGVSTINPASLGKISFGGRNFDFNATYKQFSFRTELGINKIILNKDDLTLENNGVFSFSNENLINPGVKKIDRYFSSSDNIKYIITNYKRPLENSGIKTARAVFNLAGATDEKGRYNFLISIPGLNGTPGADNYLEIENIHINLRGKNIFQKIIELIGGR